MQHAGFDWKASSALVGAFAAKELFVSQLAILNAVSDSDCDDANEMLRDRLRESYTPLQAFSIILFCLISMPCIATVAVVRRETNSWPLAIAQLATLISAFVASLPVYQADSPGLAACLSNTLASGHALRCSAVSRHHSSTTSASTHVCLATPSSHNALLIAITKSRPDATDAFASIWPKVCNASSAASASLTSAFRTASLRSQGA